mgnify:CR=1 FL=1
MKKPSQSVIRTKKNVLLRSMILPGILALILIACEKPALEEPAPDPQQTNERGTGWIGTENASTIPNDPMLFGNGSLPSRVDLTPYLPPVGNQGQTGTCVAWACGYYQRSALQAIRNNYTGSQLNNSSRQFSPKDLFWSIPIGKKNDDCNGTRFENAYDKLLQRGVATMQTVPFQNLGDCSSNPMSSWTSEAGQYKIESYRELPLTVEAIKSKLAEKRPLTFGAMMRNGFYSWRGSGVMRAADVLNGQQGGGHAMSIVGYDDAKGAFRIANSWGTNWGDNGFAWIDYNLMTNPQFTKYVFVAYDKPSENPVNPPTTNGMNIAVNRLADNDNPDESNPRQRRLTYNVKNTGNKTVRASKDWSILYLYVNAYDIEDLGVILHRYISNDEGWEGDQGPYDDGIGISSNRWLHVNIEPGETLGQAFFGSATSNLNANFTMPSISGSYYLVMIADAFEDLDDENMNDNIYFIYGSDGGPIRFSGGVGQGFNSDEESIENRASNNPHTAVNPNNLNAYRPDEIRGYLLQEYKAGRFHARGNGTQAADVAGN